MVDGGWRWKRAEIARFISCPSHARPPRPSPPPVSSPLLPLLCFYSADVVVMVSEIGTP